MKMDFDRLWTTLDIDPGRLFDVFKYDPQAPMIFNSGIFLWLFAGFILVYLLLQKKTTARLLFVTLFSYYFYYKSSGMYFFLLAVVTVSDFFIARLMAHTVVHWRRKVLVALSLTINLGLLAYFKYTNFLGEVVASLMGGTFRYGHSTICWIMPSMYPSFRNWWQAPLSVPAILFRRYVVRCLSRRRCLGGVCSSL